MLRTILGDDDEALTRRVAADPGAFAEALESFVEQAALYRAGAEAFDGAAARIVVALTRATA